MSSTPFHFVVSIRCAGGGRRRAISEDEGPTREDSKDTADDVSKENDYKFRYEWPWDGVASKQTKSMSSEEQEATTPTRRKRGERIRTDRISSWDVSEDEKKDVRTYSKIFTISGSRRKECARQVAKQPHLVVFMERCGREEDVPGDYYADAFVLNLSAFLTRPNAVVETHPKRKSRTDTYRSIRVRVRAGEEGASTLLTREMEIALNPMTLTLRGVRAVPGILRDGREHFESLRTHCHDVYASCNMSALTSSDEHTTKDDDARSSSCDMTFTPAAPHESSIRWNFSCVVLLGDFNRERIRERLTSRPLVVELHDRDIKETEESRAKRIATWNERVRRTETTKKKKSTEDVFDVDCDFISDMFQRKQDIANRSAYGHVQLRLDALLERASERANAFARSKVKRSRARAKRSGASSGTKRSGETTERFVTDPSEVDLAKEKKKRAERDDENEPSSIDLSLTGPRDKSSVEEGRVEDDVSSFLSVEDEDDCLLDDRSSLSEQRPYVLNLSENVLPRKRKISMSVRERDEEWDLTEPERAVRRLGAYARCDTRMRMTLRLARPLYSELTPDESLPMPIFERAAFVMPYDEPELLLTIRRVHKTVNMSAFGETGKSSNISLRTYQLGEAERSKCDNGELDVLTGFQVVDDDVRLVIVEGRADGSMRALRDAIASLSHELSDSSKVLMNDRVRFTRRAYTSFDVDLKMIRLRDRLNDIVTTPAVYNRSKVSALCFQCLNRMYDIRNATSVKFLQRSGLFPSDRGLLEVENKYGETVSLYDMEGQHRAKKQRSKAMQAMYDRINASRGEREGKTVAKTSGECVRERSVAARTSSTSRTRRRPIAERKRHHHAPLSTTNEAFIQHLLARSPPPNFVSERRKLAAKLKAQVRRRRRREESERRSSNDQEPVYIYGSQKLNSVAKQMDQLRRDVIAKDRNATYTFSRDFHSATIAPVNPNDVWAQAEAESKTRWILPQGFKWPFPKDPSMYNKHPKKPSAAEIEELHAPWNEPNADAGEKRGAPAYLDKLVRTANGFDTTPVLGGKLFGMLLSQDESGRQDPNYWKSVHLCGEGLAKERAEAKRQELELWKSKVVVDNTHFLSHSTQRRTNQIDRYDGLLKTKPRKLSLRALRRRKRTRPGGVHKKFEKLPISLFNEGPYVPSSSFAKSLCKSNDTSLMTGALPFRSVTSTRNGSLLPRISKAVSRRTIEPLRESEKRAWTHTL